MKNFQDAVRSASLGLAGAVVLALSFPTPSLAQGTGHQGHAAADKGGGSEMRHAMSPGMDGMMSMSSTGDVDRDFATMMKMHHQMAIDMSKAEMDKGKSPEMKKIAEQIIKDSQRDVQQFDAWLGQKKQ